MSSLKLQKRSGSDEEPELASIWTPAVVERIAAHLPPNETAYTLKLLDRATSTQLSSAVIRLSQPVPRGIFAAHWQAPDACRDLPRAQRQQLLCLTASSGDVANLEVALAAAGLVPSTVEATLDGEPVVLAAARAGHLECCQLLVSPERLPYSIGTFEAVGAAAAAGHLDIVQWCWDAAPDLHAEHWVPIIGAAEGGHRGVCEAYLSRYQDLPTNTLEKATLAAARGGHSAVADWLGALLSEKGDASLSLTSLLAATLEGCGTTAAQRLLQERMAARSEAPLAWADLLCAALRSRAADWRLGADWALSSAGSAALKGCYEAAAKAPAASMVERFGWLKAAGSSPTPGAESGAAAALKQAAESGNAPAVEWLLGEGLAAALTSAEARAAAQAAAESGQLKILQRLHEAGCALSPAPLLGTAACRGHLHVVRWLHETHGAEALAVAEGSPSWPKAAPVEWAACSGSDELLAWLLSVGCEATSATWRHAAAGGCQAILELLLERKVPMETGGEPYVEAAWSGDLRTLGVLLRIGMPVGDSMTTFLEALDRAPLPALQWLVNEADCEVDWEEAEHVLLEAEEDDENFVFQDERVLPWVQQRRDLEE